jgi:hypothetical protein
MNSAEKAHTNADFSVNSVLHRFPVFRISMPFLSKFITASRRCEEVSRMLRRVMQRAEHSGAIGRCGTAHWHHGRDRIVIEEVEDEPVDQRRLLHEVGVRRARHDGEFGVWYGTI